MKFYHYISLVLAVTCIVRIQGSATDLLKRKARSKLDEHLKLFTLDTCKVNESKISECPTGEGKIEVADRTYEGPIAAVGYNKTVALGLVITPVKEPEKDSEERKFQYEVFSRNKKRLVLNFMFLTSPLEITSYKKNETGTQE